jgi:hypothetical protein
MDNDDLLSNEVRWLQFWRLDVTPKVKNHAWQVCSDVVLTRMCPSLFALWEPWWNLETRFLLFPLSIECWKHVELWEKIEPIMQFTSSMQQLFLHFAEICQKNLLTSFVMLIMLSIWKQRNNKLWDNITETPQQVATRSHLVWDDWKLAQTWSSCNPHLAQVTAESSWKKPPSDIVTINRDISFPINDGRTSWGFC